MRALRNLCRMPARSAVLAAVYFVLAAIMIAMLIVHSIATSNIDAAIGPLESCVKVSSAQGNLRLSLRLVEDITDNFGIVNTYHAEAETIGTLVGLKYFSPKQQDEESEPDKYDPFSVIAVTSTDTLRSFYADERVIVSGGGISRAQTDNGTLAVVVSQSLADLNGLKLGDPLKLRINPQNFDASAECTVYVSGIYEETMEYESAAAYSFQIPKNTIYIPLSVYKYMMDSIEIDITPKTLYFEMKDISPATVAAFEDRLHRIGNSATFGLTLTPFTPENEAAALSKLTKALDIAIGAVMVCFAVSLFGVLLWNFESRTREIGIYCALGVKRRKISAMLTRETFVLFLGAFISAVLLLSALLLTFGEEVYSFLSSGILETQYETSVDTYLHNEALQSVTSEIFSDSAGVLRAYLLPTASAALLLCLGVIALIYIVSRIIVSRLEIMSVMGGRAQ